MVQMMASTIRHLMCWILLTIRSRHVMYTSTLLLLNYQAIFYAVGFCQSKTALFDWTFFRLNSSGPSSYRQSSRFYSCCALPRGGWCEGVLLYSRRNRLAALFFALSPRATARRTFVVALGLAESRQSYVRGVAPAESRQSYNRRSRCWQHGIKTARCCRRVIHAAGERN